MLEIGCGNGRDAKEILRHTQDYTGIDISSNLIQLARNNNPQASFIQADIENYTPQKGLDVIFAFASLIHVSKETLENVMVRLYESLNQNGILFVSLKYAKEYEEVTKTDEFGTRTYYHYSQEDTIKLGGTFKILHTTIQEAVGQVWIDVLYQKN